jgi:hypothetical protein
LRLDGKAGVAAFGARPKPHGPEGVTQAAGRVTGERGNDDRSWPPRAPRHQTAPNAAARPALPTRLGSADIIRWSPLSADPADPQGSIRIGIGVTACCLKRRDGKYIVCTGACSTISREEAMQIHRRRVAGPWRPPGCAASAASS